MARLCMQNKVNEINNEIRKRRDAANVEIAVRHPFPRWKATGPFVVDAQRLNRWLIDTW